MDLERKQRKELSRLVGEDLQQYQIKGNDSDWSQALADTKQTKLISVKSGQKRLGDDTKAIENLINSGNRDPEKKKSKTHRKHK